MSTVQILVQTLNLITVNISSSRRMIYSGTKSDYDRRRSKHVVRIASHIVHNKNKIYARN